MTPVSPWRGWKPLLGELSLSLPLMVAPPGVSDLYIGESIVTRSGDGPTDCWVAGLMRGVLVCADEDECARDELEMV